MAHLSVNVDHVATLRQARQADYPDPVEAATIAEQAGASGITVHLRSDRRHIQDQDVRTLRQVVHGKLNLEMATTDEMVSFALDCKPDQVTLVPERPEEVTTEGGLDLLGHGDEVGTVAKRLADNGISVSVFIDPDPRQIERLSQIRGDLTLGFEINTDSYSTARGAGRDTELAKIIEVAELGMENGLLVYAGHGLNTDNVGAVAAVPQIEELNIGHAIVSRAVLFGMEAAVREMLTAMATS
ncbi:MAG: pyridoxine 5'-phosphate synthase [Acidobacteria bacterium]|nr:MAG: pyridoxine 5'-phosphate synthase [Acidobacteriota bacterium]